MPTLNRVESAIDKETLGRAAENYFRCLNLPKNSQILIVTDKLPEGYQPNNKDNLSIRNQLVSEIEQLAGIGGHRVLKMEYDGKKDSENVTSDEKEILIERLNQETTDALQNLEEMDPHNEYDHTTTIVYLGESWTERTGLYKAANEFSATHKVRLAGSLGFTTGDCRVMASLDTSKMEQIRQMNEKFEKFFKDHPQGNFDIKTEDTEGRQYNLSLEYNTDPVKAPFLSDLGTFDDQHEGPLNEYTNIKYINAPGGEIFGSAHPFKKTNGSFVAEGLVFTVENGLVTHVEMGNKKMNEFESSQQGLINLVNVGKPMPFGELGIGFYDLLGIETFSDSSILSREKRGPHAGLGHGETSDEEPEISSLAGSFRHTDFLLDKPKITWHDLDNKEAPLQFYPPVYKYEEMHPIFSAPLQMLFELTNEIASEFPQSYVNKLNVSESFKLYFNKLKSTFKNEQKLTRKFDEVLRLLKAANPDRYKNIFSDGFYGILNLEVRNALSLLTQGYLSILAKNDGDTDLIMLTDNYMGQLFLLTNSLGKNAANEITLAEFAEAIMNGTFDPLALSRNTGIVH